MVTAPASTAWALVLALHGLAAPFGQAGPSSRDPQSVAAKPIDPSVTRSTESPNANDDQDSRPLPPGVYRAGKDVSLPRLVTQVAAHYTSDAMRAQIQGVVRIECIVGVDGKVSDVRVVRSLDTLYGLDEAVVRAVKQWTFEPGEKDGVAVPVLVFVESTFTMSPAVQPTKTRR